MLPRQLCYEYIAVLFKTPFNVYSTPINVRHENEIELFEKLYSKICELNLSSDEICNQTYFKNFMDCFVAQHSYITVAQVKEIESLNMQERQSAETSGNILANLVRYNNAELRTKLKQILESKYFYLIIVSPKFIKELFKPKNDKYLRRVTRIYKSRQRLGFENDYMVDLVLNPQIAAKIESNIHFADELIHLNEGGYRALQFADNRKALAEGKYSVAQINVLSDNRSVHIFQILLNKAVINHLENDRSDKIMEKILQLTENRIQLLEQHTFILECFLKDLISSKSLNSLEEPYWTILKALSDGKIDDEFLKKYDNNPLAQLLISRPDLRKVTSQAKPNDEDLILLVSTFTDNDPKVKSLKLTTPFFEFDEYETVYSSDDEPEMGSPKLTVLHSKFDEYQALADELNEREKIEDRLIQEKFIQDRIQARQSATQYPHVNLHFFSPDWDDSEPRASAPSNIP